MKSVKPFDQEWIDRNWFPRAHAVGLRRMALVVPYSGLSRLHVDDILGGVPGSALDIQYFATVESATDWLALTPAISAGGIA